MNPITVLVYILLLSTLAVKGACASFDHKIRWVELNKDEYSFNKDFLYFLYKR